MWFSEAMHALARARLQQLAARVRFLSLSLRATDWSQGLEPCDFVITHQAVHELRQALLDAGFGAVDCLLRKQALVLHRAQAWPTLIARPAAVPDAGAIAQMLHDGAEPG